MPQFSRHRTASVEAQGDALTACGTGTPSALRNDLPKERRLVDVSISRSSIRNSAGEVVHASAIVRDIGKRSRAERKLQESEERFREVFEHAPFGICVGAPDTRFIQVNAAYCRMLGYSSGELLGATEATDPP